MGLGGLLLLLIRPRRAWAVLRDAGARGWALGGALGVVAYPLALYPSMRMAGVALANVVALGSGPVFAALIEWRLERGRPGARWLAGTGLAIAGVVLLALGRAGAIGGEATLLGVLLALLSGLGYAWYAVASARAIRRGHGSTPAMGAVFGAAGVVLVPLALLLGGGGLLAWPTAGVVGYLAIGPLAIAYILFGIGVRALPAASVTTITLLEPVVATGLAVAFLHETLGALGFLGIALVLAAVLLVARAAPARPGISGA